MTANLVPFGSLLAPIIDTVEAGLHAFGEFYEREPFTGLFDHGINIDFHQITNVLHKLPD